MVVTKDVKAYCCTGILYSSAGAEVNWKTDAQNKYKSTVFFRLLDIC